MPGGRRNRNLVEALALHMAAGGSVAKFAEKESISKRTCYGWTKEPTFKDRVTHYRARITDAIIGQLAREGKSAVKRIGTLARKADNEGVRLAANRAILADLINVTNFAASTTELRDLRAKIEAMMDKKNASRTGKTSRTDPAS